MQDAPARRDSAPFHDYPNDINHVGRPPSVPPQMSPGWAWVHPPQSLQLPPDIHLDHSDSGADGGQPPAAPGEPLPRTGDDATAIPADLDQHNAAHPLYGQGRRLSEGAERTLNLSSLQHVNGPATNLQSSQQLRKRARLVVKRHAKLAPLRQSALLVRDRSLNATQMVRDQRKLLNENETEFMTTLAEIMKTSRLPKAKLATLEAIYDKVTQQRSIVSEHVERRIALENELSSLQFQLMERESAFADSAQRLCKSLVRYELAAGSEARSTPSSRSTTMAMAAGTQQPYDPLVHDYLSKVGTYQIMFERMDHLVSEHQQDRAQRILRADQGETLDVSDDAFELAYDVEYKEILASLQAAEYELDTARNACIEKNVDISDFEQPYMEDVATPHEDIIDEGEIALSETPSTIALPTPVWTPDAVGQLTSDARAPLNLLLSQGSNPLEGNVPSERPTTTRKEAVQEKVRGWMSTVESDQADLLPPAPQSQPVTPLQKPRAVSLGSSTASTYANSTAPTDGLVQGTTTLNDGGLRRHSSTPLLRMM